MHLSEASVWELPLSFLSASNQFQLQFQRDNFFPPPTKPSQLFASEFIEAILFVFSFPFPFFLCSRSLQSWRRST